MEIIILNLNLNFRHKMENFSSGPPESRSPGTQRFRPIDPGRHRMKEMPVHYEDRSKRSRSPYFENHYAYRSPSPNLRPYSPNRQQIMTMPSPPSRDLSSPTLRDRPPFANDRRRRRLSPRRDRSRERRRRISPKKRTPPPPVRSPPVRSPPVRSPPVKRKNGLYTVYYLSNFYKLCMYTLFKIRNLLGSDQFSSLVVHYSPYLINHLFTCLVDDACTGVCTCMSTFCYISNYNVYCKIYN